MPSSQEPPSHSNKPHRRQAGDRSNTNQPSAAVDEQQFEQTLLEVEQALQALKERYTQVQADQQHQAELQYRLNQLQEASQSRLPELQTEIKQIKRQLEELEVALESRLLSWSGFKEVFWQIVRFGGLGVVVGWILRSCTR